MWFCLIFIQREAVNCFAPHRTLCDTSFINVHYISFRLFFWLVKTLLINSSWVPSHTSCHPCPYSKHLSGLPYIHWGGGAGLGASFQKLMCRAPNWWINNGTMFFSLLLSVFLSTIMKGWHYKIGVSSSLNSMKGEQPLRCKPYPLHLQKSRWPTHYPISFWFTNNGLISSFWAQLLVSLINTSRKARQQKDLRWGWLREST